MSRFAAVILALGVAACATQSAGGIATLDALRDAHAACAAKGGALKLRSGGDSQYLEDYACKRN